MFAGGSFRGFHSWAAALGTVATIATIVATVSSCGNSHKTVHSDPASTQPASRAPAPIAVVNFTPTKFAKGAHGTVAVSPSGESSLRLVIELDVPQYATYGIALWANTRHWRGLYTGAEGENAQSLIMSAHELLAYPRLDVGEQIVRAHVTRHHHLRIETKSVKYRQLLEVPTGEILNKLLATRES